MKIKVISGKLEEYNRTSDAVKEQMFPLVGAKGIFTVEASAFHKSVSFERFGSGDLGNGWNDDSYSNNFKIKFEIIEPFTKQDVEYGHALSPLYRT